MSSPEFLNIAHRGASSYAPENTFAAFDLALEMGVRHLELDVQRSRDGQAVIVHDATVDRTTDGEGAVADLDLAQLQQLDAGSWFHPRYAGQKIPLLRSVLNRYQQRAQLHLEIKSMDSALPGEVIDLIRDHDMSGAVTLTSFKLDPLQAIRRLAPELCTGWLLREVDSQKMETAQRLGLSQICPKGEAVTRDLVATMHDQGFVVRAWGIRDETLMRQVLAAGVDGMTVDFPDKLFEALSEEPSRQ